MPAFLGVQSDKEYEHCYWDLVDTPGVLGVRKAKSMSEDLVMMIVMVLQLPQVDGLLLAAPQLDVDEKRGEGGAPHLGLRSHWHG